MSVESFRGPGGAVLYYRYDDFTNPWEVRPTVILAHGHPRNSSMLYAFVPELARDFRIVRPDLRGLGLSKVPIEGFRNSMDSLVRDAIALMDYLQLEKAVWIGEATGAMVGLHLAALVPERMHCVVAMSIALRIREAMANYIVGQESITLMLTKGMRAWARVGAKMRPWMRDAAPECVEWYVNQIAQNDPLLAAEFYRPMPEVDVIPLLKDIRVPTMYIDGDRESVARPEHLDALRQNPNARVTTVEGPGWDIGYTRPEACVAVVKAFVREVGLYK